MIKPNEQSLLDFVVGLGAEANNYKPLFAITFSDHNLNDVVEFNETKILTNILINDEDYVMTYKDYLVALEILKKAHQNTNPEEKIEFPF